MKVTYPAIAHLEDNSYWVEFPDLAGCFSSGDTLPDAISNAEEALRLYISSLRDRNLDVPPPSKRFVAAKIENEIVVSVELRQ